jgi:hypothetical protein
MKPLPLRILMAAILLMVSCRGAALAGDSAFFEKPVRLEADGKIIDTGDNSGHSGPTWADVDGDGVPDLVIGDFSGQFRVCRNFTRIGVPRLGPMTYLMAGGVRAKVPIYCCIGSSPLFADFDGDGRLDLISGSYDPGACYLFRGIGGGQFAARETLVDRNNKPLLRVPDQQQVYQSFGSWPALVDWDDDGDLDLLVGGFDGTIHVFLNVGTRRAPQFTGSNFRVQADGKDLKIPGGHAAPVVVDWDGDGHWTSFAGPPLARFTSIATSALGRTPSSRHPSHLSESIVEAATTSSERSVRMRFPASVRKLRPSITIATGTSISCSGTFVSRCHPNRG